ncbi:MAG TPA: sigma-54-dependent Fis family transcriptional regulator [Syntrophus sp. (in: bacteria)]|nr:sigma-54-dependent Fis family transcriptional regulator [Syntrophus sp. (in: bacteria)]
MSEGIIVIDDERDFLESVRRGLIGAGFRRLSLETSPCRAAEAFRRGESFDIALIDVSMPEMDGVSLLEEIKNTSPDTECIMITAVNDARVAVECLKKGAYDYLTKPVSRDDLVFAVKRALERKRLLQVLSVGKAKQRPQILNKEAFRPIVTQSEKILRLLREAELHAVSDVPVLITGESGTGKELLAKAVHRCSQRSGFPFTSINMASLTDNLFEAEFFGHTKGAFTGADKERAGFLESTHRGTLFLDEIGDLPYEFQGKLLRVLQDGEFMKLGTSVARRVDIRIIAATNTDLEVLRTKHLFRNDLYWRLKGAWLHIPPLRERKEDLFILIQSFLKEFCPDREGMGITGEAMAALSVYEFPGNIRELRSIVQAAINLADDGPLSMKSLPPYVLKAVEQEKRRKSATEEPAAERSLAHMEREYILRAYEQTGKNKLRTAKLLGIGLNTLRRKLSAYNVE